MRQWKNQKGQAVNPETGKAIEFDFNQADNEQRTTNNELTAREQRIRYLHELSMRIKNNINLKYN
jgi:hypothetical protein